MALFVQEFNQGVDIMQQTRTALDDRSGLTTCLTKPVVCHSNLMFFTLHISCLQAVSTMINGLLRDPRVFCMDGSAKWIQMYERQRRGSFILL